MPNMFGGDQFHPAYMPDDTLKNDPRRLLIGNDLYTIEDDGHVICETIEGHRNYAVEPRALREHVTKLTGKTFEEFVADLKKAKQQPASPPEGPPRLWVIDSMIGLLPILKVCPLVRETAASYIVNLGSGGRTTSFRKNTAGRRYFLSEAEAVRWLRKYYAAERKTAARQVKRMDLLLAASADTVILFARGDDQTAVTLEQQIRSNP